MPRRYIFGARIIAAVFYRANPTPWKPAAADASAGISVRTALRLAVWACCGGLLPLLRFALFGMPKIFPTGIAMSFELAAYGLIAGALYAREKKLGMAALYRSLICAMVGGRVIWGSVQALLSGIAGAAFTWKMFLSGAIVTAIPGIVLQLALIPVIVTAFERAGIMRFEAQK